MSVPLPSPSHLPPASATAKAIPRSRPQPISTADSSTSIGRSPARRNQSPAAGSPGSPGRSGSLRTKTARSVGFGSSIGAGDADNWRDRSAPGPKSAVRTVGGFEKKSGTPVSATINSASPKDTKEKKDKEDKEEKAAALSHVPCRFFKAGACTAGSACPFSHEEGGKREVCQWFLKGNCKFGHKCALAHIRPGEPISMDRKNKKAAQQEAREKEGKEPITSPSAPGTDSKANLTPDQQSTVPREARRSFRLEGHPGGPGSQSESGASPVPIRSALSSSIQSPPAHRIGSSPLREPIGPPPVGPTGGTSPGFARSPIHSAAFASSPSRPSPLSASFSARGAVPGTLSLKSNVHSPLRPPTTAFSSSFSHSSLRDARSVSNPAVPLSASFADGQRKNIWARNESSTDQPDLLSPRRPINRLPSRQHEDVFEGDMEDEEDHREDLLPSSLSELLTPRERARRLSRRESNESFSASPGRAAFLWNGGERLAQSATATMGPGFLNGLWSAEGADARKAGPVPANGDLSFGQGTAQPSAQPRQSLLTQQRSPVSPQLTSPTEADTPAPFFIRPLGDPASPGTKALQEHAPGQSLPGGLANALSRLHLHGPRTSSGLAQPAPKDEDEDVMGDKAGQGERGDKANEHEEEGLFAMDG